MFGREPRPDVVPRIRSMPRRLAAVMEDHRPARERGRAGHGGGVDHAVGDVPVQPVERDPALQDLRQRRQVEQRGDFGAGYAATSPR